MPVFKPPDAWQSNSPGHLRSDLSLSGHNNELQIPSVGSSGSESHKVSGYVMPIEPESENKKQTSSEGAVCTDRAELIERIKRGESPTWVPSQTLQQEYLRANGEPLRPSREQKTPSPLLPAAQIQDISKSAAPQEELHSPYEIERPRSALHAGDFTKDRKGLATPFKEPVYGNSIEQQANTPQLLRVPSTHPWYTLSPALEPYDITASWTLDGPAPLNRHTSRHRAPSTNSYSSASYIVKTPTTPLVQQLSDTDLDPPPDGGNRRHTLPPHALRDWHSASNGKMSSASPSSYLPRSYRRETSFPFAHQARRSLNSSWSLQHPSSLPTPGFLRSRRTSFSSEASPRQHASMVGSYEESILHGRMSTAPSKPFDFTAHIGALGKGNRPKMPAHVTIPFQAVFYEWPSSNGRSTVNDEPSPYVGNIDLEHLVTPAIPQVSSEDPSGMSSYDSSHQLYDNIVKHDRHPDLLPERAKKRKRATNSINLPHGCYRIPEQGQIQVVVKNPYKTALKLFLVPYDLSGMEPGQKTFVRQRYYSAGPIIERPIASPATVASGNERDQKKPTLRYLIHLNICCPARGRYYLYQHIRVVFANRVPDDKEYLSKEIQEPRPKYTAWKLHTEPLPSSTTGARLKTEDTLRRRNLEYNDSNHPIDSRQVHSYTGGTYPYGNANAPPVPSIPFHLPPPRHVPDPSSSDQSSDFMDMDGSRPTTSSSLTSPLSSKFLRYCAQRDLDSGDRDVYTKLNKGEAGYGGFFGRPGTPEPGQGLLARRLRGLGMQRDVNIREKDD